MDNNPFQLESPTSSFRLSEKLFVAGTQSELNTNDANLYLEKGLELSSGKLSSTGGRVDVQDNFTLIGGSLDFENTTLALDGTSSLSSGSLAVSSGTLALGGGFEKNGGTLHSRIHRSVFSTISPGPVIPCWKLKRWNWTTSP